MFAAALPLNSMLGASASERSSLAQAVPARRSERLVSEPRLCDLIEAVAERGDRTAFVELFRHFAPRLKAYCVRRGANPVTAEELVQEAMLSVWRKAGTFDRTRATASTWIFTIVRNERIDALRRESRPEIDMQESWGLPDAAESAEEAFGAVEAGEALQEAISKLPEEQYEVLRLAFFEDKSHRHIAEELGLPLGTVKSRVRLALARLRVVLAGQDL